MFIFDFIEPALCFGEGAFLLTKETRVFNELAVGQGREGFQPNVNAHRISARWKRNSLIFAGEADVPFLTVLANGAGLDCARADAVYFGLDLSDFGERDCALPDTIAALRVGDAVVLAFAFQAGVSRRLTRFHPTEEGLESEFDTDGDILQYLAMNSLQFGVVWLPRSDCLLLLIQSRRLALRLITNGSLVNKAIIDTKADNQRLIKRSLLHVIGEKSVFYTNLVHVCTIPQYSVKSNYRDINQTAEICRLRKDDALSIPLINERAFRAFLVKKHITIDYACQVFFEIRSVISALSA